MPTTYTSLLGLALPATGELSGTWGTTVNTEITSLLDSAIAGTTTLNTDADVTLTTTTGAANQARQAIILWTANGTVTRNITAPAASKLYTVINASAGTQSIVIRGVGPTAGVTIVKGESAVVAWNGSDFIKISSTGGPNTFTNLTVSGTTTLSGLTASTALALDASKNVVSVTNTGTGNNVLATSPTLVTPNLGTPSAIVLTNATGLPIGGITGLGTGVGTALAVNVGTAGAFVVNGGALGTPSSGTVTNLTGTASININGTVGATTPTTGAFTTVAASGARGFRNTNAFATVETIQSAGGVGFRWALANDGNFYMQRTADGFATAASTPMFVGSNDRIGIGTTTPDALLTVAGVAAFGAGTELLPSVAQTGDLNTGMWFPAADNIAWSTGGVERMSIDNGGFVGIGTPSPDANLTVNGVASFVAGTALLPSIAQFGDLNTGMWFPGADTIAWSTAGVERMSIESNGFVGIGTGSPDALLTVNGVAAFGAGSSALPSIARSGDPDTGMWFPAANTIAWSTGGLEAMRITSARNVVIGGTAAIGGNASVYGGLYLAANDSTAELQNYRASDNSGAAFSYLNKSRGTIAAPTVVQSGDSLGSMIWRGYDGGAYAQAAIIRAEVDGTPGSGDMPGRLSFLTSADGTSTPTERMRVKSAGQVRFVPLAADPTVNVEDGDCYYNSSTNKLRLRAAGAWVDLN
jgi:hypothetical protein